MGRTLGFIALLIVVAAGFYIYSKQAESVAPAGAGPSPKATVDITGVKNDLLNIAKAERSHFALEGKYASLDDLRSSGELSLPTPGRGPYQYSLEMTDSGFRVVATYGGAPGAGLPQTIRVDENMQVK